ncbi:uncharacterized protein UV8b_04480 [Ustilaginoidea virens]|uniref:Phosphatidylglycerol/phosphatidylinositol transfer protein n=1 Tax=Ustilaginoidea virens TaxID=1159556 RepID=A0A063BSR3_USTVR|nr:uncharacterized protein UV8b_04480 [Ustilaginoidea virens]QUC20239.1 hypothetical protein UV8b_04480 [Ustilaginoidea virens]GAO15978.1 hypothetical protein UVI_02055580 [Ustilaginoidea virens]
MRVCESLLLTCLVCLTYGAVLQDCGSTAKDILIHISGCPDSEPVCVFTAGQLATIKATFRSTSPIESASIKLWGVVGPAQVAFPLTPSDACGKWGLKCPSAPGARQTLKIDVPIDAGYPKIKVGVKMELVTDKGEKLICKSVPVEIK